MFYILRIVVGCGITQCRRLPGYRRRPPILWDNVLLLIIYRRSVKMYKRAFTLIELLIVVAIIAILAAIAVPNFLEAQTRAKISRVQSDMRTASTALESYVMDHNKFPPDAYDWSGLNGCWHLTTPIAYMTTWPRDPFNPDRNNNGAKFVAYSYMNYERSFNPPGNNHTWANRANLSTDKARRGTLVKSIGPDRFNDDSEWIVMGVDTKMGTPRGNRAGIDRLYDPTNGTVSWGDIARLSGETGGLTQQL